MPRGGGGSAAATNGAAPSATGSAERGRGRAAMEEWRALLASSAGRRTGEGGRGNGRGSDRSRTPAPRRSSGASLGSSTQSRHDLDMATGRPQQQQGGYTGRRRRLFSGGSTPGIGAAPERERAAITGAIGIGPPSAGAAARPSTHITYRSRGGTGSDGSTGQLSQRAETAEWRGQLNINMRERHWTTGLMAAIHSEQMLRASLVAQSQQCSQRLSLVAQSLAMYFDAGCPPFRQPPTEYVPFQGQAFSMAGHVEAPAKPSFVAYSGKAQLLPTATSTSESSAAASSCSGSGSGDVFGDVSMIPSDQIHPDLVSPIIDLSGDTQNQEDIPDAD